MECERFWLLESVSDAQLRRSLSELLANSGRTEARIIAHLAEVEERRLHFRDGSESLYAYCINVLHLSNTEAFHRITAARIARRFPLVFTLLQKRALHLTAICLLRDYLTAENHRELLNAASHKSKSQVEELIARRFPRPDVESRIRKLPTPRATVSGHSRSGHSRSGHSRSGHSRSGHSRSGHSRSNRLCQTWPPCLRRLSKATCRYRLRSRRRKVRPRPVARMCLSLGRSSHFPRLAIASN